jgi:hypothetical protein
MTEPCQVCGQEAPIIWVHGHGQCSKCKTNIRPCCDGETETREPSVDPRQLEFPFLPTPGSFYRYD